MSDLIYSLIIYLEKNNHIKLDKLIEDNLKEDVDTIMLNKAIDQLVNAKYISVINDECLLTMRYFKLKDLDKLYNAKDLVGTHEYFKHQEVLDKQYQNKYRKIIKLKDELEEDYFKKLKRHEYLIDNLDESEDIKDYLNYFISDMKTYVTNLEDLISQALNEYDNWDLDVSSGVAREYLKVIKDIFEIIYHLEISYPKYDFSYNYIVEVDTYTLEHQYKIESRYNKEVKQLEDNLKALKYGVDVLDLDKEISYRKALKLMHNEEDIENKILAKKYFEELEGYRDSLNLAFECDRMYHAYFALKDLRVEIADLENNVEDLKLKIDVINAILKSKKQAFLDLNDKYDDLKSKLEMNKAKALKAFEAELEVLNEEIKENMFLYNDLVKTRIGLKEDLDHTFVLNIKAKKETQRYLDEVLASTQENLDQKTKLDIRRNELLNQKEMSLNQPEKEINDLQAEIQLRSQEIEKIKYESHRLTQDFLTTQNSLNIKRNEYREYGK